MHDVHDNSNAIFHIYYNRIILYNLYTTNHHKTKCSFPGCDERGDRSEWNALVLYNILFLKLLWFRSTAIRINTESARCFLRLASCCNMQNYQWNVGLKLNICPYTELITLNQKAGADLTMNLVNFLKLNSSKHYSRLFCIHIDKCLMEKTELTVNQSI